LFYIITRYCGGIIKNHKAGCLRHRPVAVPVKHAVSERLQATVLRKVLPEAVVTLKWAIAFNEVILLGLKFEQKEKRNFSKG
jgi:hypothetical protein